MHFSDAAMVKTPIVHEAKYFGHGILDDHLEDIPLVAAGRSKLPGRVKPIASKLEIRGTWVECSAIVEEKSGHCDKAQRATAG